MVMSEAGNDWTEMEKEVESVLLRPPALALDLDPSPTTGTSTG